MRMRKIILLSATVAVALAALPGCKKSAETPATTVAAPLKELPPAEVELHDVADIKPGYNIAVSYDPAVGQFAALSDQVQAFVTKQSDDFKFKVKADTPIKDATRKPTLSLYLSSLANTTTFVTVAANGSAYYGIGEATPVMQRWVFLPATKQLVTMAQLFPGNKLAALLDAPGAPIGMEPLADDAGKIGSIRFVYAHTAADNPDDAVTRVTLDADQLKDAIDPKYRELLGKSPDAGE